MQTDKFYEKKVFYIRLEFIKDFFFQLIDEIDKTFLGDDIMLLENKKEHFMFCLNKICKYYEKDNILIKKDLAFSTFLFEIIFKNYYDITKTKKTVDTFKIKIADILSYNINISDDKMNNLLSFYQNFNKKIGTYVVT